MHNVKKVYSNFLADYFHLIAFVIDDCNYNCHFCYNIKPRTKQQLDLCALQQFIQNIYVQTGKNIFLELLGGEPTLHPDLLKFCIKSLKQMPCVKSYVFTNFSKPFNYYLELLKNNVALSITWHSKHDDITGQSFINKVKSIPMKFFKDPGIRLRILYEKSNIKNAMYAFDSLYAQYSEYLEFDLLSDIGSEKYVYTQKELDDFNDRIKSLKPATDNDYIFEYEDGNKKFLKFTDIVKQEKFNFNMWQCNAGKDCLYVHSDGCIYPCESYYFATVANVFNGKMSSIYSKDTFKFKQKTLCKCTQCAWSWNIYKENIFNHEMII